MAQDVPRGVVLADAAYGVDSQFRAGLRELQLEYAVGVQSSVSVWEPGQQPLPAKPWRPRGRPPKLLRRDEKPHPQEWLLIEWPKGAAEPAKYWLSNLPVRIKLKELVRIAKQRRIVERDYKELKQELGLGRFEGRGWRGFHHHATLAIAAYGFLVAERSLFSPSVRVGKLGLPVPKLAENYHPRESGFPEVIRHYFLTWSPTLTPG